jgi:opacity protein-like surface antigen
MNILKKAGLLVATTIAAPSVAQADEGKGLTLSFGLGMEGLSDPDLTFIDGGIDSNLDTTANNDVVVTKLETKSAAGFHGGIGYDFGDVRFELNGSYARHKAKALQIKSVNGTAVTSLTAADVSDFVDFVSDEGAGTINASNVAITGNTFRLTNGSLAKVRNVAVTADLYYDIPTGSKVTPYVGAGVGVGGQHIKFFGEDEGFTKLTWKLAAGANYAISDKASISADFSYRQTGKGKFIGADEEFETRVGKTKTTSFGLSLRFKL